MRGVVGLEMPGGAVGRISLSLGVGSRCAGRRVPRTSGDWCKMNEAQALGQNVRGCAEFGNPVKWCLNVAFFFFFSPSAGMELRVLYVQGKVFYH